MSDTHAAIKQRVSRDDWIMRAFMGVIAVYLLIALALPLYAMLSKSFQDHDGAFIGIANYGEYFGTPALTYSIHNSLFVNAMTTVSAVIFLYGSKTPLASVAVLNMDDAGDIAPAAAMGMMIFYTAASVRLLHYFVSRFLEHKTQTWRRS